MIGLKRVPDHGSTELAEVRTLCDAFHVVTALPGRIPHGRLGQAEDFAPVVSFLASPDGGWVTGHVLRANGGMV